MAFDAWNAHLRSPLKQGVLYSMCWEDPEVMLSLIQPGSAVFTIASAGDLALAALTRDPSFVHAVDSNADQIKLSRYKAKCIELLDHQTCHKWWNTFGERTAKETVFDSIPSELSAEQLPRQHSADRSLYLSGRFEKYLRAFVRYVLPMIHSKSTIQRFLSSASINEQRSFYDGKIDGLMYRLVFKMFFGKYLMQKWGRHPDLLQHVRDDVASTYHRRMEHAWKQVPIRSNYFFRLILTGFLDPTLPLPHWARPEEHQSMQKNMSKLYLTCEGVHAYLAHCEVSYDVFNLSDVCDTMTTDEADALFAACRKVARPGAMMLVWNNMVQRQPEEGWRYCEALSKRHWEQRLIPFYGFLGIYEAC